MRPRHLLHADVAPAAGVLTRSFWDDPVMGWLNADTTTRDAELRVSFSVFLTAGLRRGNTYVLADGPALTGAAIWVPPQVDALSAEEAGPLGAARGGRNGDERPGRVDALVAAMEAHHPVAAHFYLWIVGVEPAEQGHGLGERLLAPVLAACDAELLPAYLESTNPRNVGFYRRLGFVVRDEFHPEGGPLLTGMWRDPR